MNFNRFSNRAAFTLIELLVVISVISILVGIAVPRFKGMQDEANLSKVKANLRLLQTGIEAHYMNQAPNAYPAPANAWSLCSGVLNSDSPLIVDEVLFDPFFNPGGYFPAGREYLYYTSSNGNYYVVFSNGIGGTADITGISDAGVLTGTEDDDIYATNGTGF